MTLQVAAIIIVQVAVTVSLVWVAIVLLRHLQAQQKINKLTSECFVKVASVLNKLTSECFVKIDTRLHDLEHPACQCAVAVADRNLKAHREGKSRPLKESIDELIEGMR